MRTKVRSTIRITVRITLLSTTSCFQTRMRKKLAHYFGGDRHWKRPKQGWENNLHTTSEVIDIERGSCIRCGWICFKVSVLGTSFALTFCRIVHQVQHSKLTKTSQFFSVFGGMLPEHKIPRGSSENGGPTPVSILFSKMPHIVSFMISNRYPPDIHQVSQNFQKQKKSCCSCSFELAVKLVFGFELVGGLETVAPAMAGSPHLSILDMAGSRCHSNTMVTKKWDPSRWQCEMETCRLHIHAKTKLFKLFLLSLDQLFFYWLCIARKC